MSSATARLLAPALVAAWLLPRAAAAQGTNPAAAEGLFRAALEAAQKGDYESACPKFRESQALDPAPGTLFNLAACEEKRGKLATAWALYEELAQKLPASDDRKAQARSRADDLTPKVPKLTVRLAKNAPEGALVERDGERVGPAALGVALPTDPGRITLVVKASGRSPKTHVVELAPGESKEVELEAGAEESALPPAGSSANPPPVAPPADGEAAEGGSGRRTLGLVVGGVGLVGLGVGAVTGAMVLGKKSEVEDPQNCPSQEPLRCNQAGLDAASSGRTLSLVSTIGFGVGLAGLAAGAVLILTAPEETKTGARRTWVGVAPSPHGARLSLGGRF